MSSTNTATDELRETLKQQLKLLSEQNKDSKTAYQEALRRYGTAYIMRTLEQYKVEADYRVNFREFAKLTRNSNHVSNECSIA